MTKYEKFKLDFEASGLTQKDYAFKIGKSAGAVHYMLKRAASGQEQASFQSIEITKPVSRAIVITLVGGTKIELPI